MISGSRKKQKKSFEDFFDKVNNWIKVKPLSSAKDKAKIESLSLKFEQAMDDDFNTPLALGCLFELIDLASGFVSSDKEEAFNYAKVKIEAFFAIFGLTVKPKQEIPAEVINMESERQQARKNKDFQKADDIRNEIKAKFKFVAIDTAGSATFTQID